MGHGPLPRARRLHQGGAGRRGAQRLGLHPPRLGAQDRRVLRRLADAHRARQAAAREAQPAAARRAHQPPRPRGPQLARGLSAELSQRLPADLARPLLPRRDRRADARGLEQAGALLQGRLHEVRGAEGAAPRAAHGRLQEPAGAHRAARGVHHALPLPGFEGRAGAKPRQGAGEDRAHRGPARGARDPLPLPAAALERPRRGRAGRLGQELRRGEGFRRRHLPHREGRPHRSDRRERRRQVDA